MRFRIRSRAKCWPKAEVVKKQLLAYDFSHTSLSYYIAQYWRLEHYTEPDNHC